MFGTGWRRPFNCALREFPFSSQSTRVKILKVDPALKPMEPPSSLLPANTIEL